MTPHCVVTFSGENSDLGWALTLLEPVASVSGIVLSEGRTGPGAAKGPTLTRSAQKARNVELFSQAGIFNSDFKSGCAADDCRFLTTLPVCST